MSYNIQGKVAFSFYKSFYDVYVLLNDKQKILFMDAIFEVEFLIKHIEDIDFEDNMLKLLWSSIKHSIRKQIDGFMASKSLIYEEVVPYEGAYEVPTLQEQGQVQGQEQGGVDTPLRSVAKANVDESSLHEEFNTVWSNHSAALSNTKTDSGAVRRNNDKSGTFNAYKKLRKKYSFEVLAVLARESSTRFGIPMLKRVYTSGFENHLAKYLKDVDEDKLDELLEMDDKNFTCVIRNIMDKEI